MLKDLDIFELETLNTLALDNKVHVQPNTTLNQPVQLTAFKNKIDYLYCSNNLKYVAYQLLISLLSTSGVTFNKSIDTERYGESAKENTSEFCNIC